MCSFSEIENLLSDKDLSIEGWIKNINDAIKIAGELDVDNSMMLFAYLKSAQNRMIRYFTVTEQRVIDKLTDSPERIKEDIIKYLKSFKEELGI